MDSRPYVCVFGLGLVIIGICEMFFVESIQLSGWETVMVFVLGMFNVIRGCVVWVCIIIPQIKVQQESLYPIVFSMVLLSLVVTQTNLWVLFFVCIEVCILTCIHVFSDILILDCHSGVEKCQV